MAGKRGAAPQIDCARTGDVVLSQVEDADSVWKSFAGLMLRASLPDERGIRFKPARGIHTHFMRFPIDLIFLDGEDKVLKIREAMPPWKLDWTRAATVIEANAGVASAAGLTVGDRLVDVPASD